MKALILAAGFGTRLLPHTERRPKPLFTLDSIPLLELAIKRLADAGCTGIIINTHHLHEQIESFVRRLNREEKFPVRLETVFEPVILETGGAIRNVMEFIGDDHFIVMNSDIVSDIDLKAMIDFHLKGKWCATLALHDCERFNKVVVGRDGFIRNFRGEKDEEIDTDSILAFTGVQILSPDIFSHIFSGNERFRSEPFSSIELYTHLSETGSNVKAFVCRDLYWQDIGTIDTYRDTAIRFLAADLLFTDHNRNSDSCNTISDRLSKPGFKSLMDGIDVEKLAGDGSDRGWFRCRRSDRQENSEISGRSELSEDSDPSESSIIVADHGIDPESSIQGGAFRRDGRMREVDSFIAIGEHLFSKGLPVPEIKRYDRFSGFVAVEDLGSCHLADLVENLSRCREESSSEYCIDADETGISAGSVNDEILNIYRRVCRLAVRFSIEGIKGFDDGWTFQTQSYSKDMILEKECRYFTEAFLQGYKKIDISYRDLERDFELIAERALENSLDGLMHRDMQSRNIMVSALPCQADRYDLFFIDFQSARRGPLQYDLASLLIDPYANLSHEIKETLLHECAEYVEQETGMDQERFIKSYRYCALNRNMQMLGAFSHLSMNRGKRYFERYIPIAVENLKKNIELAGVGKSSNIYRCVMSLS